MTKVEGLRKSLVEWFGWMETAGLRVGQVWLHPGEVEVLMGDREHFDPVSDTRVRDAHLETVGAPLVGFFFGAMVFSSELVVPGHMALLPDGFQARLVEGTACVPLGLHRWT